MAYQAWEQSLSAILDRSPQFKQFAKRAYQWINYSLFHEPNFQFKLAAGCILQSPEAFSGVDEIPGEHLFGYYDKSPWTPDGRHFLLHNLQSRNRNRDVHLLSLDSQEHRIHSLGTSSAWNFQQGSMLQWLNIDKQPLAIFNDFENNELVARIVDLSGTEQSRLSQPIQAVHPATGLAASINYNLLHEYRADYGYSRIARNQVVPAEKHGLTLVDLKSGQNTLCTPLAWFIEHAQADNSHVHNHWLNHVMFSARGDNLIFMHRWGNRHCRKSRLFCAPAEGGDPTMLLDMDMVSHYHWLDDDRVIAYCRSEMGDGYHVINISPLSVTLFPNKMIQSIGDGHPAAAQFSKYVVTDTYPNRSGTQALYVFNPDQPDEPLRELAQVSHSPAYHGDQRCDLHPRWHPSANKISFDSVLDGKRRCWVLDFDSILKIDQPR